MVQWYYRLRGGRSLVGVEHVTIQISALQPLFVFGNDQLGVFCNRFSINFPAEYLLNAICIYPSALIE